MRHPAKLSNILGLTQDIHQGPKETGLKKILSYLMNENFRMSFETYSL